MEPLAHHSLVILHEMGQNDRKTFEGEGGLNYVAVWKHTPATPAPKGVGDNMGSGYFSPKPAHTVDRECGPSFRDQEETVSQRPCFGVW